MELIEAEGIDVTLCLNFTPELAQIEPEDFVRDILVEKIGVLNERIHHQVSAILQNVQHKPVVTIEKTWYY